MASPYKRRRPRLLQNFWFYRHAVVAAAALGLTGWFCWSNSEAVTVVLPFGLGKIESSLGIVILLSALAGSVTTALVLGMIYAWRRLRSGVEVADEDSGVQELPEDRPPADYASKTSEGFPEARWSPRD